MMDVHVYDLLPGYALGILDEADLLTVARHLPHCPACRAELATYLETVDGLAHSVPLQSPAPALREAVIRRVATFSQAKASAAPVTGETDGFAVKPADALAPAILRGSVPQPPARSGWLSRLFTPRLGFALSGLALLLILFLAASTLMLWQRVNQLQTSGPANDVHLVALRGTGAAPNAQGYLLAFKGDIYGTLTVENAPVLDAGHQYQIWLLRDGQRTSGGVFSVNEDGYGTLMITADRPLDTFTSFGITVEPTGGSPGPTGKKVLGSKT